MRGDSISLMGPDSPQNSMRVGPLVTMDCMKQFKGHHAAKTPAQLQREIDEILVQPSAHLHHATVATPKIPSFKISAKDPAAMTAAEINRELDKLEGQSSTLGSLMIEAGRGHERPSEYLRMTDPLAMELRSNSDRRYALRIEISQRYGPNPPARLPTGRGFGPRSKALPHAAIRDPSFRLLYLAAGRRSMSPEEFSTVEDATRAVNFFKARGITAWVEDDTGKFVPVKGVRRKPSSVD